jgi:hypothetical protein
VSEVQILSPRPIQTPRGQDRAATEAAGANLIVEERFEAGERRPNREEEAMATRQRAGRSEGQRSWTRRPNPLAPTNPGLDHL